MECQIARANASRAGCESRPCSLDAMAPLARAPFRLPPPGLLSGRRVTTHWEYGERLAAEYPDLHVEPDRIFVRDGPVFSSAGVTAAIDLALSLIEEDHGRALALWVARRLVVFMKRPGGQSQFSMALT